MTDPRILAILADYIDRQDFAEWEGDPPLSHFLLWGIFVSYTENYLADGCLVEGKRILKLNIPEWAPKSGVTPLEAAAAATVLAKQLQGSRWWIAAVARQQGASWADIGDALGMSRQAAWEGFRKYADKEHIPSLRDDYRALCGESADS
jgi:hypothetical protein